MSKVVMLVLLLVAAVVLVPPLRQRARPHLQFAFDPFYEWSTRNRVDELKDLVKRQDQLGKTVPAPRDFGKFIEREDFHKDASDPWGQPYYLQRTRAGFRVGSPGKDMQRGTGDDILSSEERLVNQPKRNDRRRR
jgi:hypothetical protein